MIKRIFILLVGLMMFATAAYAQTVSLDEAVDDKPVNSSPVEIVMTPDLPAVGTPTEINMTFKDPETGVLYDRANIVLNLEHLDMNTPVFGTTFHSLNGNLIFDYGFMATGTYRLLTEVSPTEFTVNTFQPFTKEIIIGVDQNSAGSGAAVKVVLVFLALFFIGWFAGPRVLKRKLR